MGKMMEELDSPGPGSLIALSFRASKEEPQTPIRSPKIMFFPTVKEVLDYS